LRPFVQSLCSRLRLAFQVSKVCTQIGGRSITRLAVLLECFVDDFFQLHRQARIEPQWWHGRAIQNGIVNDRQRISGESLPRRCHFVKHGPKGEQIGACVQFLDLLAWLVRLGSFCP